MNFCEAELVALSWRGTTAALQAELNSRAVAALKSMVAIKMDEMVVCV